MRRVELAGERDVTAPGSTNTRVRRLTAQGHVAVIEIGPGGVVAKHPAASAQLFVVVSGDGWVRGSEGERESIVAGQAVLWESGEEHESGSYSGMTALVVETDSLAV